MNDYDRVARMIRFLDRNHVTQPALADLASVAGLSESHFHRLFRRWAGVTPKDFLQCLTVEHARRRLRESASVLDAALDSGLSGPGRLHDLFVTIESASPGEVKRAGEGMCIDWGVAESPFGTCSLGWSGRGVLHVAFHDGALAFDEPPELRANWPRAVFHRNDPHARRLAGQVFGATPEASPTLKAYVRGTAFQLKVWRALVRIGEGRVTSYGDIAKVVGCPNATRAVGTACGANPVAWLIPCHRVIRETGVVRGYRWGDTRKRVMLGREAVAVPLAVD